MQHSPQIVIHLIHGTWARGIFHRRNHDKDESKPEYWWCDQGQVYRELKKSFGESARILPFNWSGNNSFRARADASKRLIGVIKDSVCKWPEAKQILIGHSHGGSVAVMAANEIPHLAGIITIATPFIHVKGAIDKEWAFAPMLAPFVMTAVILGSLLFSFHFLFPLFPFVLIWAIWHLWAYTKGDPEGDCILSHKTSIGLKVPLHCIRAEGDEASLVLALSKVVSSLTGWVTPYCRLLTKKGVGYFFGMKRAWPLIFATSLIVAFLGMPDVEGYLEGLVVGIMMGFLLHSVLMALWFGLIYLCCLPSCYPLAAAFGPELVISGWMIEVHAEPVPEKMFATVEYEEAPINGLRHSSYNNPMVIEKVVIKANEFAGRSKAD